MDKTIDNICEEMDALVLRKLDLMQEKIDTTVEMERLLRNGYIELAKARYILGKDCVSILQTPGDGDNIVPLFKLERSMAEESNNSPPQFDISSRKTDEVGEQLKDPIKWFGILVPQNLRTAQKSFQESLYLAVRMANVQAELLCTLNKIKDLYSLKQEHKNCK